MPAFFRDYLVGPELFHLLEMKNGFYAFEQALHVLPLGSDVTSTMTLEEWNSETLWRSAYEDLAQNLFFFAEDVFGDQFCLSKMEVGVLRFDAERGEASVMADSIEEWANSILTNYEVETGWPLAQEWQAQHGPLQLGTRLQPKIPFVYGGEYNLENLWAGDAVKGMLFKGEVALKVRNVPDGTPVKMEIKHQE